jgi:hypothetical protein
MLKPNQTSGPDSGAQREQKCIRKGCILTMGYYIGGGQFICWLHALALPGCMEAVKDQEMVALVGDSK